MVNTIKDVFYINCDKKWLLFRKEGGEYISFDPLSLEFFKLNKISADIFYLVSLDAKFNDIIQLLSKKYSVPSIEIKNDIITLIKDSQFINVIKYKLYELGFPR